MSRQNGLIRLKGSIGGISFYKSGGDDLARMASGPEKSRIENDPAYARTRETNREFGGAANVGKAFRMAFAEVTRTMGERYLSARITQLFWKVCQQGTGARGERSISVTDHAAMLQHVDFNKQVPFGSLFNAPYTVAANLARNEVTVDVPDVSPAVYLSAPTGATHFRLLLVVGSLSNYVFDTNVRGYVPVEAALNSLAASAQTAVTPLQGAGPHTASLVAGFAGAPTMSADVATIAALGILFYQRVNGVDYLLAQSNGMQVVGVF